MFGDLFGGRGRAHRSSRGPAEGRRRRDHRDHRLHRRHRRRHHLAAADLATRPAPTARAPAASPAPSRTSAPSARAPASWSPRRRRRLLAQRDLPGLRRPPAALRRALPDLPRHRPRHVRADHPGPHPRRRQGRPADPAARQGRAPARTAARPATSSSPSRSAPHRLFGRKADNLTLDVPVSFDEAALGAEIKVPTLGGAPVTLKIPAGTPNGRTFRVRGKGARKPTAPTATCSPPSRSRCPRVLDAARREAVEAYRAATAGKPLRAQPLRGGLTMAGASPSACPARTRPSTSSASPPS